MSIIIQTTSATTLDNYYDPNDIGPNWSDFTVQTATATHLSVAGSFQSESFTLELTGSFPSLNASSTLGNYIANAATATALTFTSMDHGQMSFISDQPIGLQTLLSIMSNNDSLGLQQFFSGNDTFIGSPNTNNDNSNDHIFGYGGNDTFTGNSTSGGNADLFNGGEGIDTAVFRGNADDYTISAQYTTMSSDGVSIYSGPVTAVQDTTSNRDGLKDLANVERLQFSDECIAIDLDGNAGIVAKILGAVFGASSVHNKEYVGIGLNLIDSGMSYESLMQLAIDARLGAGASNGAVVDLLYANVVGQMPSTADHNYYTSLLDNHNFSVGSLGVMAADTALNQNNINLVGLHTTGLEYLAV